MTSMIKQNRVLKKRYSKSITLNAGDRANVAFDVSDLASNATVIGVTLRGTPNADWVIARPYVESNSAIRVRCHNEYTGTLSGDVTIDVLYTLD